MQEENNEIERLIKKSIQSFLMSIEIYNKPTIEYRLEGCLFFIHNAWELLLKAKLITKGVSIYYKESKDTLSLKDCAKKLMTNEKDPIRRNLDVISSYRNLATHLIVPEYDFIFLPFITFSVQSYADKLIEYFNVDINDYITTDFLSLFSLKPKNSGISLLKKYGEDVSNLFSETELKLQNAIEEAGENAIATKIEINLVRVNSSTKADFSFYQTNKSSDGEKIKYIDRALDPNSTHTLSYKEVQAEINRYLINNNVPYTPIRLPQPLKKDPNKNSDLFTTQALDLILKEHNLKINQEFCYSFENGKNITYKYHPKIITYIISIIQSDKEVVIKIKNKKR